MRSNLSLRQIPTLTLLSEEQQEALHLGTLELLQRTGVEVYSEEALDLLRKAGCIISGQTRVKIPAYLVEEAVRTAPPSITLYDRSGEPAMFLEGRNVYHGTGSDLPNVIDPFTGERRLATKADIANSARLCDALPNIDFIMSMALPHDVPVATSDLHSFDAMVRNTTKPILYTAHDKKGLSAILQMAYAVVGGTETLRERPFLMLYAEPSAPLRHSQEAVEKLLLIAERNLPVAYVPGIIAGSSAPITLPAILLIANAEQLSGLVIAQTRGRLCYWDGLQPLGHAGRHPRLRESRVHAGDSSSGADGA
jgi:trimethylamine---corrinoid protein Co-methyltransferase